MREHLKRYIDQGTAPNIRGLRILLEYFYATEKFGHLKRTRIPVVSVFGSARATPNRPAYRRAHEIGRLLYQAGFAVLTGASSGIMQAANQGVADAIADELQRKQKSKPLEIIRNSASYKRKLKQYSIGLRISLPFEEEWNPWVGTGATFHYFMVRKFFFATLSRAFIACEGGWGTRDELFELLTLTQTGKAPLLPIIYVSRDSRHLRQDLMHAVNQKYIDREDLNLINIVKTPAAAVETINEFYKHIRSIYYFRRNNICLTLKNRSTSNLRRTLEKNWAKYDRTFDGYHWRGQQLELLGFKGRSYGTVRRLVDDLNQVK